jgi:hypothetical protein
VRLGGATPVVAASSAARIEPTDLLVIDEHGAASWDLSGRNVRIVSHGHRIPETGDVINSLLGADIGGLMQRLERRFVIAGPRWTAAKTAAASREQQSQ